MTDNLKALEVDAHVRVWWARGYWGSDESAGGKNLNVPVLHDFATRVTSRPVSIGSTVTERRRKAYANIPCANLKRNRLGPSDSEQQSSLACTIT